MNISFHGVSRHLPLIAAPILMAIPALAIAAPTAQAAKPVAQTPATATGNIIALPLNPVVPAGQRVCTAKTASGLGYTLLRPATGAKPAASDFVLVNYIGYLAADGTVFDQGMRSAFAVGDVIPGFSEGLQTLTRGSVGRFCIPAAMAYGAQESGPIPANSDLVFQVELVDFKTAVEVQEMRKASGEMPEQTPDAAPPR